MESGAENTLWRVSLFGGPVLDSSCFGDVRRFRSKRVGALLAYLALRLGRPCPREELYEALWPDDDDLDAVANRFRVTLASLRRQLEPPGAGYGSVLDTTTAGAVRLRDETVWCDVVAFEAALRAGRHSEAACLAQADLLPGYYE